MGQKINKVIEIGRKATSKGFEQGGNQGQASKAERENKERMKRKDGQRDRVTMKDKEEGKEGGQGRSWRGRPLHDNSFIRKDLD